MNLCFPELMLIDTHCHLDFPEFDSDREFVLKRSQEAGVEAIINIGSGLKGSQDSVSLALRYSNIFASVGLHPHDAKDCSVQTFAEIKRLSGEKKVVAIGEVGLDYFRNLSDPQIQISVFQRFIILAIEMHLPLIIHSRQAEKKILDILSENKISEHTGVVVHCFSGTDAFLKRCLDDGFFVSFTCNVTYKKAQHLRELVRLVPINRMFLETDAPFLSPEGKRGKRNEPAHVVELAHEVARIKQLDFEKVCNETTQNAKQFFQID